MDFQQTTFSFGIPNSNAIAFQTPISKSSSFRTQFRRWRHEAWLGNLLKYGLQIDP